MRRVLLTILLIALASLQIIAVRKATFERKALPEGDATAYLIPSKLAKVTMLEFDGIAADFLFAKALVFIGSTKERTEIPRVKPWEWKWFNELSNTITDLDPYFVDPYYFANAYLTWEGGMVQEANDLLKKGSRYREWDPYLPFFVGFNYFYFDRDNGKASEWLMTAARRPGANTLYANLAARLAYEGKRTENAIVFLEELLSRTDDEELQQRYKVRLEALQGIYALENAAITYKQKFHKNPRSVDDLIRTGLIKEIPQDPYGGTFYMDARGIIKSTSNLMLSPQKKD